MSCYKEFCDACRNGHLELVKSLIPSDAKALGDGFYNACIAGHLEIVQFLFSQAVISDWDDGFSGACRHGHLKILQFILSNINTAEKENIDWNDGFFGACYGGHLEIVQFLFSSEPNKIFWICHGVYNACDGRQLKMVEFLIEHLDDWFSAIWYALYSKQFEILQLLITKAEKLGKDIMHNCYACWSRDKTQLVTLLYLKTPLNAFRQIDGFQDLYALVFNTKKAIKGAGVMLPDLLNIIAQCIII